MVWHTFFDAVIMAEVKQRRAEELMRRDGRFAGRPRA
jgi:hypothetical protein